MLWARSTAVSQWRRSPSRLDSVLRFPFLPPAVRLSPHVSFSSRELLYPFLSWCSLFHGSPNSLAQLRGPGLKLLSPRSLLGIYGEDDAGNGLGGWLGFQRAKRGQMCIDLSIFKIHSNTPGPWAGRKQPPFSLVTLALCARGLRAAPFLKGLCGH